MSKLESLIARYEAAIWAPVFNFKKTDDLCEAVEKEADRVGYSNHRRLMALHTAFEQRCIQEDDLTR